MLLEYIPVTVKAATTLDVSATTFTMDGDRNNANPDNLQFNCGLKVTSGYWAAPLRVYICKSNGEVLQTLSSSETFFLDADQSATATVSGTLPDAKTGTLYNAIFGYVEGYYVQSLGMLTFKVKSGQSGVEETSADTADAQKGTPTTPGTPSPYRDRSVEENLDLFERMNKGEFDEGARVLRAKIDMASSNMHFRDPIMYRIIKTPHHRTGTDWKVYFRVSISGKLWGWCLCESLYGEGRTGLSGTGSGEKTFAGQDIGDEVERIP